MLLFSDSNRKRLRQISNLKQIYMVGEGAAIAPLYQIVQHILESQTGERPKITLLYSGRTEADLLFELTLQGWKQQKGSDFKYIPLVGGPLDKNKITGTFGSIGPEQG